MNSKKKFNLTEKKHLVAIIVFFSILLLVAGYFYYNNKEDTLRQQKQNELEGIAQLKINQISGWYKDELADAVSTADVGAGLLRHLNSNQGSTNPALFNASLQAQNHLIDPLQVSNSGPNKAPTRLASAPPEMPAWLLTRASKAYISKPIDNTLRFTQGSSPKTFAYRM